MGRLAGLIRIGGSGVVVPECWLHQIARPASRPAITPIFADTVACAACSILRRLPEKVRPTKPRISAVTTLFATTT